jgi:hypothetical protein
MQVFVGRTLHHGGGKLCHRHIVEESENGRCEIQQFVDSDSDSVYKKRQKRHLRDGVTTSLSAGTSAGESCSFFSLSSILARSWSMRLSMSVRRLSSADAVFSPLISEVR